MILPLILALAERSGPGRGFLAHHPAGCDEPIRAGAGCRAGGGGHRRPDTGGDRTGDRPRGAVERGGVAGGDRRGAGRSATWHRRERTTTRIPADAGRGGRAGGGADARGPGETTHWTGEAMAEAAGTSASAVRRIWKAHGLQVWLPCGAGRAAAANWSEGVRDCPSSRIVFNPLTQRVAPGATRPKSAPHVQGGISLVQFLRAEFTSADIGRYPG